MTEKLADDPYSNEAEDWYPGIRQRSRPGQGPQEEVYDTTRDVHGRIVSDKPANKGMLSSQRRQREHDLKVAAERTRRAALPPSRSLSSRICSLLLIFIFLPLLSSFLTKTYTFNLSPFFLPQLRRFWDETPLNPWREEMIEFTPVQLAMYDGADDRPVYLAIGGVVYDVSANRRVYGKGGSYNMMTGRDASRAFTTGCFETHLTHDIRGLSEAELASFKHWASFFADSDKYRKVGTVILPPIDPLSPLPPPCRDDPSSEPAAADAHAPGEAAARRGAAKPGPVGGH